MVKLVKLISKVNRQSFLTLFSLLIIGSIGLLSKFYAGWSDKWINNQVAGLWYEIFWCLFFFLWFPSQKNITRIPIWVFIVTVLLEFLQLWHPPLLTWMRSSLLGRLLLGTTFSWVDFPYIFLAVY